MICCPITLKLLWVGTIPSFLPSPFHSLNTHTLTAPTLTAPTPMRLGWSDGAMVLGKLPVPGRPTIWIIVGQGPIALAVARVGVVWTFLLNSILSLLFFLLSGRRLDID